MTVKSKILLLEKQIEASRRKYTNLWEYEQDYHCQPINQNVKHRTKSRFCNGITDPRHCHRTTDQ